MAEKLLPTDYAFAAALDANCQACQADLTDNGLQMALILGRTPADQNEQKALAGLEAQCTRCFAGGKNYLDSITATSSCHWRGSI